MGALRAARLARARRPRRDGRAGALGQARSARGQPGRVRDLGALVVDVRAGGRLPVHPRCVVDPELGDPLHGRRGRDLAVYGPAHDVLGPAVGARQLRLHHDARARLLCADARAHDGHDRGVRGPRFVPLLRDVGSHAHSHVLHHRGVGRGAPSVRGHQVLRVHLLWLAPHAGGDPRTRLHRWSAHRGVLVFVHAPDDAQRRTRAPRVLAVRRLLPRVRDQGADVPVPHLASRRTRGSAHGRVGVARGRPAQDGDLRVPAVRAAPVPGRGPASGGATGHRGAFADRHPVRRPGGDGSARFQEADRVLIGRAPRLLDARHLGPDAPERPGRAPGDDQPRHLDRRAVLPGRHAVRAAPFAPHRSVRWHREGRPAARGGAHDRLAVVDRTAGHQRVRRRIPGAARDVPDVSRRGHDRDGGRHRRRDVPAPGAAARDFQSTRQEREREARGPVAARDRGARAVARLHRMDRGVPEAHPPADGAERPAADSIGAGQRGFVHGGPVSLDLANTRDLLRALLPELTLTLLGMMLMVGGEDLMVVFLGLELMSVAVYALAGINRHSPAAAEAALKYFLLGAFASGFLLYGIALVYGATATTNLSQIGAQVRTLGLNDSPMLLIGLGLLLVGFGFKVAAVPFHMWAPDVYDGSPTPVTGYMATAVKAAAFAALLRVLGEAFGGVPAWHQIVWWLAVATMVVGNLVALAQRTMKRMLAYSSIAHAGYLLVAVATGTSAGSAAFIFYLVAYTLTTLAAFALLAAKGRDGERDVRIDDLAGLGTPRPWLAFAFAVCMLSLLGFPGTAGFIGKWYILVAATAAGQLPVPPRPSPIQSIPARLHHPPSLPTSHQPQPSAPAPPG